MTDPLSADLPEAQDDGAADHLPGLAMPAVVLRATDGSSVDLSDLGPGRTVVFVYPLTGADHFRDLHDELSAAGAAAVYGLSGQDASDQSDVADRLELPYALLSDSGLALADRLGLPTLETAGMTLYRRLTLIAAGGTVEHVLYPVFRPDRHAADVLAWLRANPGGEPGRSIL